MKKTIWLNEKEFVREMKPLARFFHFLKIIRYVNQVSYDDGSYEAVFRFNKNNPLTWMFFLLTCIIFLPVSFWDAIGRTLNASGKCFDDITIDLDKGSLSSTDKILSDYENTKTL